MAGLTRYNNVWKTLFGNGFINLGIRQDRVNNVLWRAKDIVFSLPLIALTKIPPMILFKN